MLSLMPAAKYQVFLIEKPRHYQVTHEGKTYKFQGVTSVLDVINRPALVHWAAKEAVNRYNNVLTARINSDIKITPEWIEQVSREAKQRPKQIKEEAANLGTRAHELFDRFVNGKPVGEIPVDLKPAWDSFLSWVKDCGLHFVCGDTKIASLKFGFAGSLDALAQNMFGDYILIDFKNSSGIWDEYALQVAAYDQALFETYGIVCKQAKIVRFNKVAPVGFEVKTVENVRSCFEAFLSAKDLREKLKQKMYVEDKKQA